MSRLNAINAIVISSLLAFGAAHNAAAQAGGAAGVSAASPGKAKVVMQVSDADQGKWNLALGNARNLQKGFGAGNVEIEIVAFGPGIGMLKANAESAARVREARADGITLSACENTMAAQNLKKEDINPAAGFVPSGVVEIVRKQQAGYAYLRP